jgi:poly(ADP-ribose) glycohydrolase ARH3
MAINMKDKFVGCFLGLTIGDILGAGVEGMPREKIEDEYGEVEDFLDTSRGFGKYTDDTQMSLALAVSIIDCGKVYASDCSYRYAEFYEPERGYGAGAAKILEALNKGANHLDTATMIHSEGSFGNGGAMRIAPVGLTYRNESDSYLRSGVTEALQCTHVHPEAIDAAVVQAKAIGRLANMEDVSQFKPKEFLKPLLEITQTQTMKEKLENVLEFIEDDVTDEIAVEELGNGVRASEAVSCAIFAAAKYYKNPEKAIINAVGFGGDTDTIGAMTGALMGALHGRDWIPDRWMENIENGEKGRDFIINLAEELEDVWI